MPFDSCERLFSNPGSKYVIAVRCIQHVAGGPWNYAVEILQDKGSQGCSCEVALSKVGDTITSGDKAWPTYEEATKHGRDEGKRIVSRLESNATIRN